MIESSRVSETGLRPLPRHMLLADDVYTFLRDALLTNRITPGSRLIIEQLSKDLAVSITPIRHALVRLESDGLVTREPFKGYVASPLLDPDTVSEIYTARIVIETQLASRAAGAVTADDLDTLDALAHADPLSACTDDDAESVSCDEMLHRRIALLGGNRTLSQVVDGLNQRLLAYRAFHLQRIEAGQWDPAAKSAITISEHLAIVAAIRDGDAKAAAVAMRTHLTNASHRDIDSLAQLSGGSP